MRGLPRIFILLLVTFLVFDETASAQRITIKCKNERLEDAIRRIARKANIGIVYDRTIFKNKVRVSVDVDSMPVADLLDTLLSTQELGCMYIHNMYFITINKKPKYTLTGKVTDESGSPLEYVYVSDKCACASTFTDSSGEFTISVPLHTDSLIFTSIGYEAKWIKCDGNSYKVIKLIPQPKELDEAIVTGYEKRPPKTVLSPKVTRIDVNQSPVRDLLRIVKENIAGVYISSSAGLAGSSGRVQLRGPSSIGIVPGNLPPGDPLVIIDGVPFAEKRYTLPISSPLNDLGVQGRNHYENINVNDIESISLLKDAASTAIYGARGVNGVLAINTKQPKYEHVSWDVKASSGIGRMTTIPNMMNISNYLELRKEAFRNDSIAHYAGQIKPPDLFVWDTTRYTDFRNTLLSAYARNNDLHTSVSGRINLFQYFVSVGVMRDITLYTDHVTFSRASMHGRLAYRSDNRKFLIEFVKTYSSSYNKSGINELAGYLYQPPNIPRFNEDVHNTNISNDLFKLHLEYKLTPALCFSASLYQNKLFDDDRIVLPVQSQLITPPVLAATNTYNIMTSYGNRVYEPQLEYTDSIGKIKFTCLVGGAWQRVNSCIVSKTTGAYSTDSVPLNTDFSYAVKSSRYNYAGLYSSAVFQLKNTYMMSLTTHRDGSSRLGANGRYANFGAIGVGWVFYNDPFYGKFSPFLSYGKIKASYGITGNDQVDVNTYNKSWLFALNRRQFNNTTLPIHIAGEDLTWQMNRKLDLGIELRFLKDRISLDLDAYINRGSNQVIAYPTNSIGVNAVVLRNSSAVIVNKGLEILLKLNNNRIGALDWNANLQLAIPDNKLVSFPGLSTSIYANKLVVGKSLQIQQGYHYTGVDPASGLFQVADLNKDGKIEPGKDYRVFGDLNPKFFGNIQLKLNFKRWELKFLLKGVRQNGYSLLYQVYANAVPGADMINLPVEFLNRWRTPGDVSNIQRLSAMNNSVTRNAISNYVESDARITDASYIRLKNVQLSYNFYIPGILSERVSKVGIYLNAENLLTVTNYKDADPETQNIFIFPAQTMLMAGLRFSL